MKLIDYAHKMGVSYKTAEIVNLSENGQEDLLADLTSIISSFCARLYGQRRATRKTETIVKQLQAQEEE